jgi:hypothetical protein
MQGLVIPADPTDKGFVGLIQGLEPVTQELVPDRPEQTLHLAFLM